MNEICQNCIWWDGDNSGELGNCINEDGRNKLRIGRYESCVEHLARELPKLFEDGKEL